MKKEIRKLRDSFLYALRGLALCIRGERNFRVHMMAALYVTLFAVLGQASATQAAILCVCFGLTMGAELMNTAVERLCDKHASGYDMLVRDEKDIAAAAVFVCALACVAVGVCVFVSGGVLLCALRCMAAHRWVLAALAVSVPTAWWFIFRYGSPANKRQ